MTEVGGWGPWIVGGGRSCSRSRTLRRPSRFAVNRRYLINEKGALASAARLPKTVSDLAERAGTVWQAIGLGAFDEALAELGSIERELARLTGAAL